MIDGEAVLRDIACYDLGNTYPSASEILDALKANGWHAGRASQALGIGRTTLWRRLRTWRISLRKEKKNVWSDFRFNEALEQWLAKNPDAPPNHPMVVLYRAFKEAVDRKKQFRD